MKPSTPRMSDDFVRQFYSFQHVREKAMVIYKYRIPPRIEHDCLLPKDAKILSMGFQHDDLFLWALVDPEAPMERRKLITCFTGQTVPPAALQGHFIGTAMTENQSIVVHIFEVGGPSVDPADSVDL